MEPVLEGLVGRVHRDSRVFPGYLPSSPGTSPRGDQCTCSLLFTHCPLPSICSVSC